jgi:hypothetical protein
MNLKIQSAFETATRLRVRMAGRIQGIEPLRRKILESLCMLLILGTIYSAYLRPFWSAPVCIVVNFNFASLLVLLKFSAVAGWPFALMAFLDETWSSKDAGRVFLAAFPATNALWMHKYHRFFVHCGLPLKSSPLYSAQWWDTPSGPSA